MGITEYLSRNPSTEPPEEFEDETELVIALIKELNVQKNMKVPNEFRHSSFECQNKGNSEEEKEKFQTIRRHGDTKSGNIKTLSRAVKSVKETINLAHQPIKFEKNERERLNAIRKTVDSFFARNKLNSFNCESSDYQKENIKNITFDLHRSREKMTETETESNFSQKARDLDSQIAFTQTKTNHLKRPGQYRVVAGKSKEVMSGQKR